MASLCLARPNYVLIDTHYKATYIGVKERTDAAISKLIFVHE